MDEQRSLEMPQARRDGLLERRVNADLVVYDLESHRAHSLDRAARSLWRWCDGETPITTLRRRLGSLLEISPEAAEKAVAITLRRLAEAGLLVEASPTTRSQAANHGAVNREAVDAESYDRRRCLGALVALPVVAGILVPSAADAQSQPNGSSCSSSSQCASGCCNSANNRCTGGGPSCL